MGGKGGGRGGRGGGGSGYNRFSNGAAQNLNKDELKNGSSEMGSRFGINQRSYGSAINQMGQAMTAKEFTGDRQMAARENARQNFKMPTPKQPKAPRSSYSGKDQALAQQMLAALAVGQSNV
jgi:hypothetical protein